MTAIFIVSLVLLSPLRAVCGGEPVADSLAQRRPSMFGVLLRDMEIVAEDGFAWILAPISYSRNEWLMVGGIGAATSATYAADSEVRAFMQRNQQSDWYDAAALANEGGRVLWAQTLTGALYIPGLVFDVEELRITGRMLGQSLMYSGALTMALRILLGRDRPYSEKGPSSITGWKFGNAEQSMPSGHTTVAFAIASVLSRRVDEPVITVLLYTLATATGLARMYHDQHWASDVLLGAVIGYSGGMFVSAREEKRNAGGRDEWSGWRVIPSTGGLTLSYRF